MEPRDDIRQQMLELIYGLLPDDQSAALAERIRSDGRLARQYAELKERTELLAEAAKAPKVSTAGSIVGSTPLPSITDRMAAWKRAAAKDAPPADRATGHPGKPQPPAARPERPGKKSAAWNGTLVVLASLAACLLVGAFGYPWLHQKNSPALLALAAERAALPQKFLAVSISGPAQLAPNQRNQFQAQLQTVASEPVSGEVEYAFKTKAGHVVYAGRTTARDGQAEWIIPPDELHDELTLEVVAAASGKESRFSLPLRTAPPVVRATLETDRPQASPGQRLHFRGITLTEPNHQPVETEVLFELIDPQGNRRSLSDVQRFSREGVAQGSVQLGAEAAPGTYRLVMRSPETQFQPAEQRVRVESTRQAPYRATWHFAAAQYKPGDPVTAALSLASGAGQPVTDRPLVLDLPTPQNSRREQVTDDQGKTKLTFALAEGEGPWWIATRDRETGWMTVTPVPLRSTATQIEFFPEGGVLAEGLANQVFFFARDTAGQAAPLAGKIKDDRGTVVAEGVTLDEGRGAFTLTPEPERTYTFHLRGDQKTFALPPAQQIAAALHVPQGVTRSDEPLEVEVSPQQQEIRLALIATQDGVTVGHEIWDSGRNLPIRQHISLRLPEQVTGVVELGLYQLAPDAPEQAIPLGSRLVYREAVQRLEIDVRPGKQTYQGGEMAELLVQTRDEFGYPVEAQLGVRVGPVESNRPTQQPWGLDWSRRLVDHLEDPAALEGIRDELESGAFEPRMLDLILATDRPRPASWPGEGIPGLNLMEPSLLAALRELAEGQTAAPLSIPVTGREWETLRSLAGGSAEPVAANRLASRDRLLENSAELSPGGQAAQGPLPVLSWSNRAEVVAAYRQALAPLEEQWQAEIAAARTISHWVKAVSGVLLGLALIGLWTTRNGLGWHWRRSTAVGLGLAVSLASLAWGVYWLGPFSPSGPAERMVAYRDADRAEQVEERTAPPQSAPRAPATADRSAELPARRFVAPGNETPGDDAVLGRRDAQTERAETRGAAESAPAPLAPAPTAPLSRAQPGIMADAIEAEMDAEEAPPVAVDQARESQAREMRAFSGEPARQRSSVPSEKAAPSGRLLEPATDPVLWRPAVRTDRQGAAQVTFSLPNRPGLYRVEVNGFGQGRIGSRVVTLEVE